jgi:hypothetical protein
MSTDQIVIAFRPSSMRLFHKGQSHHSFSEVLYQGQNLIDLEFDVTDIDVLLGSERNANNNSNYCNPLSELQIEKYFRNGSLVKNIELLIESINKVLGAHFSQLKSNKSYYSIIARAQLCVVFEIGITPQQSKALDTRLKSESFAGYVSFSSSKEYFNSLPESKQGSILLKSVGSDLYILHKKAKIEMVTLTGVAVNPEIEIIAREIFNYIDRAKSHIFFSFEKEMKILTAEAERVLDWHHPTVLQSVELSSGRTFEYQVELAQCKLKADQMNQGALIIKGVDSIIKESALRHEQVTIFYTGENVNTDYFKGLLTNNYTNVIQLEDDYSIMALLKGAEEKLANLKVASSGSQVVDLVDATPAEISKPTENKATVTNKKPNVAPPPPTKTRKGVAPPLPPPPAAIKANTSRNAGSGRMSPPPPPPPKGKLKSVSAKLTNNTSASKVTESSPKTGAPPPRSVKLAPPTEKPAKGKKMAPPPPPPLKVGAPPPLPRKKSTASNSVKKMAPPPPPPPRKK